MKEVIEATPESAEILPPSAASFFSFYSSARSSLSSSLQRTLNAQASKHRYDASLTAAKDKRPEDGGLALAHAKVTSAPLASTWKSVTPVTAALTLSDAQYRVAARLNLRLDPLRDMSELTNNCPACGRQNALTNDRWHFLTCKKQSKGEISIRHDAVKKALYHAVLTLGGQAVCEPVGLSGADGRRPDLQIVFPGQHLITDVVVSHPLAPSAIIHSAVGQTNAVAIRKEQRKRKKYNSIATKHGASFLAFSLETCGGIAPEAVEVMERIGRAAQEQLTLWSHHAITQHMLHNIAIFCLYLCIRRVVGFISNTNKTLCWSAVCTAS